jgi:AraC-like DNA-binding protein
MRWSLSEFLNLVEPRSQTWCFIELASASGFSIPCNDAIYFYAVLEGSAHIAGMIGDSVELGAGDIVMIQSGAPHTLRNHHQCVTASLDFLTTGEYADTPPTFTVGQGRAATRLLAGRLKIRWPGGQHPRTIPSFLRSRTAEGIVNLPMLLDKATGSGAMALLTRAATLLFVDAFRDHPQCRLAFQGFSRHDPVSRARQYMELHPFDRWSVEILACKVGMGRSNFATRFARDVGRTPMEFLFEERMKHAALFLEMSDMKIAEIGKRIGYDSEAAFARRFKSHFGIPPGELRKRSRETAQVVVGQAPELAPQPCPAF